VTIDTPRVARTSAGESRRRGSSTSTAQFGVSRRESHDATDFYERFPPLKEDGTGIPVRPEVVDALKGTDWFGEIAPEEYEPLYAACVNMAGFWGFPDSPLGLTKPQRDQLKGQFRRKWPVELGGEVAAFNSAVSQRSASALNAVISTKADREHFHWRLLRLHSAPYFILGTQPSGPIRLRVLTPWDFRRGYRFAGLEVGADHVGQPQISWSAAFVDLEHDLEINTRGHVEIRWSHGKLCGAPEAKIYLDTPHVDACGYQAI
jgi:hypothetical protein